MNKQEYAECLKTPQWRYYREVIFQIHGMVCNRCRTTKHLQVHHKRYISGLKPWQYKNPNDLEVLCVHCHQDEHGILNSRPVGTFRRAGDVALMLLTETKEKRNAI